MILAAYLCINSMNWESLSTKGAMVWKLTNLLSDDCTIANMRLFMIGTARFLGMVSMFIWVMKS